MSRQRETPSPAHPDDRRIRTLAVATLCNSAAVLPAGLTVILAVQIRNDLGITPFQFGLGGAMIALPASPAAATGAVQLDAGIGPTVGTITFGTILEVSGSRLAWATMAGLAIAAAVTVRAAAVGLVVPHSLLSGAARG